MMSANEYPVVLVPARLDWNWFDGSTGFEPQRPVEPLLHSLERSKQSGTGLGCFAIAILLVASGISAITWDLSNGILALVFGGFMLLPIITWRAIVYCYRAWEHSAINDGMRVEYASEMEEHKKRVIAYEAQMKQYRTAQIERGEILNKVEPQRRYIKAVLSSTQHPFTNSDKRNAMIGRSENQFFALLSQTFGERVRQDISVSISSNLKRFDLRPDVLYHHSDSKLTIAIEIDEPYEMLTAQPIHYIGADDERNAHFLEMNWLVVRFSERQVVKFPNDCIRLLKRLEVVLTSEEKLLNARDIIEPFPIEARDRRWTVSSP